jgi:hypothetical protein
VASGVASGVVGGTTDGVAGGRRGGLAGCGRSGGQRSHKGWCPWALSPEDIARRGPRLFYLSFCSPIKGFFSKKRGERAAAHQGNEINTAMRSNALLTCRLAVF